jgi:A/G-specific adenine glycosylase
MQSQENVKPLQDALLAWYRGNARDLPWRRTKDPYAIWVSEIMLQQTRVATVIPYYERFLQKFPTPLALATAKEEEVLKLWEGLGYYSRAKNLHAGAKEVVSKYQGSVPNDPEAVRGLPGIGPYTAGAILSIAFNRDEAILDGNVARVLSRVYGIEGDPRLPKQSKKLWELSRGIVPTGEAGTMNQALMELGASLCSPKNAACLACPIRLHCEGGKSATPEAFGAREKKGEIPTVEVIGVLLWVGIHGVHGGTPAQEDKGMTAQENRGMLAQEKAGNGGRAEKAEDEKENRKYVLARRPSSGLLADLWELPSARRAEKESPEDCAKRALQEGLGVATVSLTPLKTAPVEHVFTHLRMKLSLYTAQIDAAPKGGNYQEFALFENGKTGDKPLPGITLKALQALRDAKHWG